MTDRGFVDNASGWNHPVTIAVNTEQACKRSSSLQVCHIMRADIQKLQAGGESDPGVDK